jgi:hypothetical protein
MRRKTSILKKYGQFLFFSRVFDLQRAEDTENERSGGDAANDAFDAGMITADTGQCRRSEHNKRHKCSTGACSQGGFGVCGVIHLYQ